MGNLQSEFLAPTGALGVKMSCVRPSVWYYALRGNLKGNSICYIWESNYSADIYNILSSKFPNTGIRLSPGLSVTSLSGHWREHLTDIATLEPTKISHTLRLPLNSDCMIPETTKLALSVHIPRALYRSPYSTQPRLQCGLEWVKAPHNCVGVILHMREQLQRWHL